jgi:hypothetical protein
MKAIVLLFDSLNGTCCRHTDVIGRMRLTFRGWRSMRLPSIQAMFAPCLACRRGVTSILEGLIFYIALGDRWNHLMIPFRAC